MPPWDPPPRLIAHRGASREAPENTLAAFRAALDAGAQAVELDVHLAADDVPVVIHDDTLDRTTSGAGPVGDRTSAEMAKLDAGSWFGPGFAGEGVPTLDAALALLAGRCLVDIEVKVDGCPSVGLVEAVAEAVTRRSVQGSVVLSSFDRATVRRARSLGLATALIVPGEPTAEDLAAWRPFCDALAIGEWATTKAAIEEAKLPVYAWTVDDPARARELLALGVTGIITNDPRGLRPVTRTP